MKLKCTMQFKNTHPHFIAAQLSDITNPSLSVWISGSQASPLHL